MAYWDFQNQREVVEHGKNQAIIDATANAKAEAEKSKGSAKWSRRYAVATLLIAAYTALVEPLCNPAAPDKESQGRDNAHKDLPEQVAIPALPKPVSDTVKNDSTAFLDTRKKDSAKPK